MTESAESQREELENLRCIYDDIWTVEEDSVLVLYAPVPYTDGAATFICKLPSNYPAEPLRSDSIGIEGVQRDQEATFIAMLQLQGFIQCENATYDRSGDSILFDVISAVREALAWRITDEQMEELIAEADAEPEAEADDTISDCSDRVSESGDWQTFESNKRDANEARRRAKQQAAKEAGEPDVEPKPTSKQTLTGNNAWKARLQDGETVSFRGGGNSLAPLIKSGECCTYAPVFKHEDVKERDVVFCQIKGRFWGHMVKKKTLESRGRDGQPDVYNFTISNIHGHENGDCKVEKIYGRVIAVSK